MSDEKDKDVRLNNREKMIGSFLSKEVNKATEKTECPLLEDIAAFIDGKLYGEAKDKVMRHLSSCEECYEVFSEASKTQEALTQQSRDKIKKIIFYSLPSALAVAALILIVLKITLPSKPDITVTAKRESVKPGVEEMIAKEEKLKEESLKPAIKEYAPPSSSGIATMLTKHTDVKSLVGAIKEETTTAYGFSSSVSLEKASFRLGVYLTDLEIALRAEDREKSAELLNRIIKLIDSIEGSQKTVSFYKDIMQKIQQGISLKQFVSKSQKVEELLKSKDMVLYLRFGEWVEGGRLAAIAKDKEYFDIKTVQYFIRNLMGKGLPQGVIDSLKEIEEVSARAYKSEKEFKQLGKAFDTIIDVN